LYARLTGKGGYVDAHPLIFHDDLEQVAADAIRDHHVSQLVGVCMTNRISTGFGHGELQVREHLVVNGDLPRQTGEGESREQEVVGLRGEREAHDELIAHRSRPSIRPRMVASARRSSLETCI